MGLAALAVGSRYARHASPIFDRYSRWIDRDPVGPSEDVVLALGRTTSMKISTEAEALAYAFYDEG